MKHVITALRQRRGGASIALFSALVLATSLLGASPAAAHQRDHHTSWHQPSHSWFPQPTDQALALDWFDVTKQTVAAATFPEPVTQSRTWAVSWLGAARAVQDGFGSRFQAAAFATALHDALAAQVPSQQPQLDAALASSLAEIPDTWEKRLGVLAGQYEASRALAQRAGDGLDTASVDTPYTPPAAAPGVWQPTPPTFGPAVRAGQGSARSFLLASNDQFRPGPPPALNSPEFLKALAEIHAVGSATSSVRTPAQTDTANFIAQDSFALYGQALRAVLEDTHHSLAWDAQAVAAFHVVVVDTQIAIFEAKYVYTFWRPVTAIRTGSVDPDPSWTPLLATPRHPEYPSGHAGYAGAAEGVLTALTGPTTPQPIAATSTTAPGSVHTYTRWSQITQETIDGRVWEGVHYRFSDETAADVGKQVAAWDLPRLYRLGL
ncbi:MAG TPA: vanadium-dependent haloperoxidase [Solirubrobacterales bacterium]|nr:vanadium-dependent haloperoxidase [Solirubrobacterales bacterium]